MDIYTVANLLYIIILSFQQMDVYTITNLLYIIILSFQQMDVYTVINLLYIIILSFQQIRELKKKNSHYALNVFIVHDPTITQ